jgi:hypothetical protein
MSSGKRRTLGKGAFCRRYTPPHGAFDGVVSLDRKKMQSETDKIVAILDKPKTDKD